MAGRALLHTLPLLRLRLLPLQRQTGLTPRAWQGPESMAQSFGRGAFRCRCWRAAAPAVPLLAGSQAAAGLAVAPGTESGRQSAAPALHPTRSRPASQLYALAGPRLPACLPACHGVGLPPPLFSPGRRPAEPWPSPASSALTSASLPSPAPSPAPPAALRSLGTSPFGRSVDMGEMASQLMEANALGALDTLSDIGSLRQHLDIPLHAFGAGREGARWGPLARGSCGGLLWMGGGAPHGSVSWAWGRLAGG